MLTVVTSVIRSQRLDLIPLSVEALRLIVDTDLSGLQRVLEAHVEVEWPRTIPARVGLNRLATAPEQQPWLTRAMLLRAQRRVIGNAGFHGPPDPHGRVEIGYEVLPSYQRRGYASEAARALMNWAHSTGGASVCIAGIAPDNLGSLALAESLGFVRVGTRIDADHGRELVFERPLPQA
jgi:[ribosomal protein S5]-alanine N-acetyltransferase